MSTASKMHGRHQRRAAGAAARGLDVVSDVESGRNPMQSSGAFSKGIRQKHLHLQWAAVAVVVLILYLGAVNTLPCWLDQKCMSGEPAQGHNRSASLDLRTKVRLNDSVNPSDDVGQTDIQKAGSGQVTIPTAAGPLAQDELGQPPSDRSIRCKISGICDNTRSACDVQADGLGCVTEQAHRREHVSAAIQRAWKSYRRCGWGYDEVMPIACKGHQWFGLGLTMIDSLDTLVLAGLHEEVEAVTQWIAALDTSGISGANTNTFECTIRVVGGLLSAAHLVDGDRRLLQPAVEVALRLLVAFNSKSGIPYSDVDLKTVTARQPAWTTFSSLSEATTLSLEFCHVARVAGYDAIAMPAQHVWEVMRSIPGQIQGLAPIYIAPDHGSSGSFGGTDITLGARGDSYYEYMLKQYIISGKTDAPILEMYHKAMQGVRELLVGQTAPLNDGGLLYIGERNSRSGNSLSGKMDHLVCFLPGLLALGHYHGVETGTKAHHMGDLEMAEHLMHTCYSMYRFTPTGLAPELVHFQANLSEARTGAGLVGLFLASESEVGGGHFKIRPSDAHSILRPETIESLFVLWRVTGDTKYQDWGWQIFRAFEMHARLGQHGYTSLESVLTIPAPRRDRTESFFIAETLKYFLLLFSPHEVVSFDSYVFNTEAHPLPIMGSSLEQSHSTWYMNAPKGLNSSIDLHSQALQALISQFRQEWSGIR